MQNLLDGHSFKPVIGKKSARLASQRRIRGVAGVQSKGTLGELHAEDLTASINLKGSKDNISSLSKMMQEMGSRTSR